MGSFKKDKFKKNKNSFLGCEFIFLIFISISLPVLLLLWKFVIRPYWQEALFYTYISIGIISGFASTVSYLVAKEKSTHKDSIFIQMQKSLLEKSLILRLRVFLDSLFHFVWKLTAWPAHLIYQTFRMLKHKDFIDFVKTRSSKIDFTSLKAEHLLISYDLVTAIIILANILIVYLVNYLPSNSWRYSIPFLIIMVIHILSRHLNYAISTITLPQKLRQTYGNPYIRFVAICLADLLGLLLSFALIISLEKSIPLNFSLFEQIAMTMLKFKKIQDITDFRNMAFIEIVIIASGVLYYYTLLKVMIRFKEFKRADDDYRAFAELFTAVGKFDKSLNYLKKVKIPNLNDFGLKSVCFVGKNKIDEAYKCAKLYLNGYEKKATKNDVFSFVLDLVTLYNVPKEYFFNVIKKGISSSIRDSRLYSIILPTLKQFDPPPNEDFEKLFQNPIIKDSYPMSYSYILISRSRYNEALKILSKIMPKSNIDKYIHISLWIILQCKIGETEQSQKEIDIPLLEVRLTEFSKIARKLTTDWEKSCALTILETILIKVEELPPNQRIECLSSIKTILNNLEEE